MLRRALWSILVSKWTVLLIGFLAACGDSEPEAVEIGFEEGPPLVNADGKSDVLGFDLPAYAPLRFDAVLDSRFEVVFAPDDPVTTVEVSFIERVIEARKADQEEYAEGENPYRIRYAVYNLRNERIVQYLAKAHNEGVDVQILIEADQLDPAKDYNTSDEYLIEQGLEFHPDHKVLTAEQRKTGDLIGITGSGLMHLKTRIFTTPEKTTVLSGSLNPGDNAVVNEESLHIMQDRGLVARYEDAYTQVLTGKNLSNSWDANSPLNVMFTPVKSGTRAVEKMFDWLSEEQEQILLMTFSLRDVSAPNHSETLVQLLARKKREGVNVVVITDRKQSDGVDSNGNYFMPNDKSEDRLREAGIPVYEATNLTTPFTAMHHKSAILGRTNIRVITDAANWTAAGLGTATRIAKNVESQLFIDSAALDNNRTGKRYLAQWARVLNRYAYQSVEKDNQKHFNEMFGELSSQDGWPQQETWFELIVSGTRLGESVAVRGSHETLGFWNSGLRAMTTAETFPIWDAVTTMPVGEHFEYKLTIEADGRAPRWEDGENRFGFVQPAPLTVEDRARLEAEWR
jgi:phosphatidylserine/phosphatidylglycerophosphate/cardiolipin synthase-like enzyme